LFAFVLATRIPFAIDVLRERGELFHIVDDSIRNDYTLKVVNKSQIPMSFNLSVLDSGPGDGSSATLKLSIDPRIEVPAGDVLTVPLSLTASRAGIERNITNIKLQLCELAGERCVEGETRFIAPPAGATSSRDKTTTGIPDQVTVGAASSRDKITKGTPNQGAVGAASSRDKTTEGTPNQGMVGAASSRDKTTEGIPNQGTVGAASSRDKTTEEIPNQSRVGAPLTTSPNVRKIADFINHPESHRAAGSNNLSNRHMGLTKSPQHQKKHGRQWPTAIEAAA
ncbi:MAG: hypothetical protein HKN70_14220, partial [Gammaproteobacteria bacterium]|nr:hypothetical protein [Gammaproteobacteria bacterium]